MLLDKYKTFYLSSNIKLQVFHLSMDGVYVKILDEATQRRITISQFEFSKLVRQIRVFKRIKFHSFNWHRFFYGEYVFSRIYFSNKLIIFNKYLNHIVLDELSIDSLLHNESQLVRYFN